MLTRWLGIPAGDRAGRDRGSIPRGGAGGGITSPRLAAVGKLIKLDAAPTRCEPLARPCSRPASPTPRLARQHVFDPSC